MADFKQLLLRNRFTLEILCIVALADLVAMRVLDQWAPQISGLYAGLLDALGLLLISTPLIFWRSSSVHGRETQSLSKALQSSSNAVLLLDKQGRIYWVNEGFTRTSGYTLEDCKGATPEALLGCGLTSAEALEQLRRSRTSAQPCRVEVCNRHKQGQLYWCDIDLRPDFDRRGRLVGYIEICTDITELVESKLHLKASLLAAEAIRYTIDTHAIVSVADREGLIIEANDAFCTISGYSREQLLGSNHRLLNSGTHSPEFWAAMWDSIAHGKPWRGEICNRNRQGDLYWVDSMIAPFPGVDGLVEKYVSIRIDITQRKLLEREREQQSRLLAVVVDSLPYGTVVFDENQEVCLRNPQYARVLRLPSELLEQSPFRLADQLSYLHGRGDFGQDTSAEALLSKFSQAMAARTELQLEHRQVDGSYIELHSVPIANGWTVLTYVDITERKLQALQLSDVQERVRMATESAGIGIWSLNPKTGVQSWDAQQYRLFGLSAEADCAVPIYDLWIRHLHPDDAEAVEAEFLHSLTDGVPFASQFRIIRPDGAVRHIKALGSPRVDAEGQVEYIVGTNQDVTDAVLLEVPMQEARLRAEEATRVKSQFIANMSHEIRTPMNAVLGLLQLLEYTVVDARQHAYVTQAEQASRLMLRLIDGVLDHSRLEAEQLALHLDAFGLDAFLEDLAVVLSASVEDKNINVLFDVPLDLPEYLVGDHKRLHQVLVCLLDNAIKFTASGEVICRIALVQQSASQCRIAFCVRDTGIGIAAESLGAIFSEFVQLQSGSTRAYGGLGLGLPVAQRLVHLMGGTMEVQSKPGEGSSFFFTLDLGIPQSLPAQPQSEVWSKRPDAAALVVDACPGARSLIAAQAGSLLSYAETASTCQQALDMVRRRLDSADPPYCLILLDWNMPDADSWLTLQQVRALYGDSRHEQPQVIMLSNNSNQVQQTRLVDREGLSDGALAKPFTKSMLRKALLRARSAQHTNFVAPVRAPRLQGMRVLVVEDSRINQLVIQAMLKGEGAIVCMAENGRLGVDAVRASLAQQGFDMVLMDLQMPVMDGYEAAREIRNGLQLQDLPIIAISANVRDSDRAQCFDAGMNFHIGKPYELDELVAVMLRLSGWVPAAQAAADDTAMADAPAPADADADADADATPDTQPMPGAEQALLHVYWIQGPTQESRPDGDGLLQRGVVLHLLDSVEALAARLADGAALSGLVVADMASINSTAMRDLRANNGAGMKAMAWVVLADMATEDDMQACIRAGAVDMVPLPYALENVGVIARKHFNAQGELRVDINNHVVAIDGHAAMARIQADLVFFGGLLRTFFDELPMRRKLLHDDWSLDPAQVKNRSHALKGLAVTLGFESLAQVARQGEALEPHPGDTLDGALLLQLDAEMESARFQILRWLNIQQACDARSQ